MLITGSIDFRNININGFFVMKKGLIHDPVASKVDRFIDKPRVVPA
jgi:hypothetical protein